MKDMIETLKRVQTICNESRYCHDCPFFTQSNINGYCILMSNSPCTWKLDKIKESTEEM